MAKLNGDLIRAWAKKNNTSLRWLGEAIGHNSSYVNYYLSTKSDMPKMSFQELETVTGIPAEKLRKEELTAEEIEEILSAPVKKKEPEYEPPTKNDWWAKQRADMTAKKMEYNEKKVTREEFLAHAGEGEKEAKLKREEAQKIVKSAIRMPKVMFDKIKDIEITITIGDLLGMVGDPNAD